MTKDQIQSERVHCSRPMKPISFERGYVCLTCGATHSLWPKNANVTAELLKASALVLNGMRKPAEPAAEGETK